MVVQMKIVVKVKVFLVGKVSKLKIKVEIENTKIVDPKILSKGSIENYLVYC